MLPEAPEWPPDAVWEIKAALLRVINELYARKEITPFYHIYGSRIVERAGRKLIFSESLETSTRILGWSNRKNAQRARKRFAELGILRQSSKGHGKNHAEKFSIEIPEKLFLASMKREKASVTRDSIQSRAGDSTGDEMESHVYGTYSSGGRSISQHETLRISSGDYQAPNTRLNRVPQTSEQYKTSEPLRAESGVMPGGALNASGEASARAHKKPISRFRADQIRSNLEADMKYGPNLPR